MDLRQQRSRAPQRPAVAQPATTQDRPVGNSDNRRGIPMVWKIVIGVVLLLGLLGYIAYSGFGIGSPIDKSKYQAVFLSNGQVYFGKLSGWGGAQPTLTDVYYFQASANATEADPKQPETANNTQTLVKLGEEIHKPSDKLILNRDSILFVENIEDDGQVVEAIKKNQQNKD